ncbi:MAG: hypothetical protein RIR11_4355 [Bacteroidota bacterium]|jgi:hypothetical protein
MNSIYAEPVECMLSLSNLYGTSPAKLISKKWQVITLSFLTFAG